MTSMRNTSQYVNDKYRNGTNNRPMDLQGESKPSVFNPQIVNTELLDASVKMGYQATKQVLENYKLVDYFSLQFLKPYFDINNRYVMQKLKYILLPFTYKQPENDSINEHDINEGALEHKKNRIEYPDMYLPLMSFITYILLIGFHTAHSDTLNKGFDPDILGIKATKNFFILLLYTIILKTIFYIFCNISLPFLDLLSYASYKFFLLVINVIIWIIFKNYTLYYALLAYSIFISMIFMHKVLNFRILKESDIRIQQKLIIYIVSSLEIVTIFLIMLDI